MPRVSFLSHDTITKSPNVYPPYLYGGIGNLFPGYPPYPHETTGYWLHLTNKLTFTQCNVVTTRQLTNTARDRHCGQILKRGWIHPPRTAHDMITVCLLLFRALILNSTRTSRRLNLRPIKKTRWKKSRLRQRYLAHLRPHDRKLPPISPILLPCQSPFAPTGTRPPATHSSSLLQE